jgi:hypothetical protein
MPKLELGHEGALRVSFASALKRTSLSYISPPSMKAKIIKTEAEYTAALARVESLMDAKPGSPKAEELELWSLLVERYEQEQFPIDLPDPVEAIKFPPGDQASAAPA